jgi:hypothetical protein
MSKTSRNGKNQTEHQPNTTSNYAYLEPRKSRISQCTLKYVDVDYINTDPSQEIEIEAENELGKEKKTRGYLLSVLA